LPDQDFSDDIVPAMTYSILGLIIIFACLAAFVWWQNKIGGRWGMSLSRKNCPRCGAPLPMFRKPASASEIMWGGWTCQRCGCKVDKYGREIALG
jgi:hypothetical protein